jgi:hypothetical protein
MPAMHCGYRATSWARRNKAEPLERINYHSSPVGILLKIRACCVPQLSQLPKNVSRIDYAYSQSFKVETSSACHGIRLMK